MSTEVKTEKPSSPNGQPALAPVPARSAAPGFRIPRRRYQVVALVVLLAVVGAVVGNNVLTRQYTPEGAVRQYLGALQAGDIGSAWSAIQVSSIGQGVTASMTDRAALQAAIGVGKPDIKSFDVAGTSTVNSTTRLVDVSVETSKGSKGLTFIAQRSGETRFLLYPV